MVEPPTKPLVTHLDAAPSAYEVFRADLGGAVARLRARCALVVGVAVLTWFAVAAIAFLWPKTYRAEVILVPASIEDGQMGLSALTPQFSGLASLAGLTLGGDSHAEALALLRSRGFIESFIEDERLLPVIFFKDWNTANGTWRTTNRADVPTLWNGYDRFRRKILKVEEDKLAGVVTVCVDWHDPGVAAQWANSLVSRLNRAMRERTIAESARSLRFLDSELQATNRVALRDAISRLMEVQMRSRMLASVREEYSFRVVDAARPPHPKDLHWPKRVLLIAGGVPLGILLSVLIGLLVPEALLEKLRRRVRRGN